MTGGTLLLDSEGLARLVSDDDGLVAIIRAARRRGATIMTTTMTTLEGDDPRVPDARFRWTLSKVDVQEITRDASRDARALLREHKLRGHSHAIDAAFAAIARSAPKPVAIVTSDPDDMRRLAGPGVRIISLG
ncbi:hypothetical protein [Myceligenerans crystallogenes]|uniref:PIN domain-containing protein n=1 Tax=Myceligenerans crystallogenes TaxID=316335 RepID=A0ABN2N8R5_9MICO